uniref:Uncharacterized protein n=1 Tax=Oryza meridionalis TaxID=40149 RepID=A0A0E0CC27_9ORYZ
MAHGQSLAQLPPCLTVPLARVREAIVRGGEGGGRRAGTARRWPWRRPPCPASTGSKFEPVQIGDLLYVFSRLAHPAATVAFTMKPQYLLRRKEKE